MADAYICRRGGAGGGASLELVAVGNPRPTSPQQNTIWVDTDTEITGWAFSTTTPENPTEGLAWIAIGNSGAIKMSSPVGDEWVTVYPISAKQYVNGAWVAKTAKSYQGGEWVGWITYLYNSGEISELIGGFTSYAYRHSGSGSTEVKPTQTNGTDSITLKISLSSGSAAGSCFGNNKIDVSAYSKLCIHVTSASNDSSGGSSCHTKFGLTSTRASGYSPVAAMEICKQDQTVKNETFYLDISELSGSYYFYITLYGSRAQNMTFTKLYFE